MPYRAKTSFHVGRKKGEKVGRLIGYGMILKDDDPLVKKYPHLFENVDDYVERVEQATAAPGEVRNRPPKKKDK